MYDLMQQNYNLLIRPHSPLATSVPYPCSNLKLNLLYPDDSWGMHTIHRLTAQYLTKLHSSPDLLKSLLVVSLDIASLWLLRL